MSNERVPNDSRPGNAIHEARSSLLDKRESSLSSLGDRSGRGSSPYSYCDEVTNVIALITVPWFLGPQVSETQFLISIYVHAPYGIRRYRVL